MSLNKKADFLPSNGIFRAVFSVYNKFRRKDQRNCDGGRGPGGGREREREHNVFRVPRSSFRVRRSSELEFLKSLWGLGTEEK